MADYFELGKLFGKSRSPMVAAAKESAETVGKIANIDRRQKNREGLQELLTNIAIISYDQYQGNERSKDIAKYAKSTGHEGSYNYWDNFFSKPTYTKDGREFSEADIEARKRYSFDVREILGLQEPEKKDELPKKINGKLAEKKYNSSNFNRFSEPYDEQY